MAPINVILYASILSCYLTHAKVYKKCELARELRYVHELPEDQIATWVCIAKHESTYNTSAINHGSGDHGLFQISDIYWCSPPGYGYACNLPCSAFEDDDITDDVGCIRRIFNEHTRISGNGFNAWTVYPIFCKGDVSGYTAGCFDYIDNNIDNAGEVEGPVYEFPPLPTTKRPSEGPGEPIYEFPPLPTTNKPSEKEEEEPIYEFPPLPTPPKIKYSSQELSNDISFTSTKEFYPTTFLDYFPSSDVDTPTTPSHVSATPVYLDTSTEETSALPTTTPFTTQKHFSTVAFTRESATRRFTTTEKPHTITRKPFILFTTKPVANRKYFPTAAFSTKGVTNKFTKFATTDKPYIPPIINKFTTKKYSTTPSTSNTVVQLGNRFNSYVPHEKGSTLTTKSIYNTSTASISTRRFFTTPRTDSPSSTTAKTSYTTRIYSKYVPSKSTYGYKNTKTTLYSKKPVTTSSRPKTPRELSKPDKSNDKPHQRFYSADKLQYNFFTKTYGFKLIGQF